jgi:uncharacterized protein (TIGR03437 family)
MQFDTSILLFIIGLPAVLDASGPPSSGITQPPRITAAGIVNAATFAPGVSPGSFASIFGENLAPATRSWEGAVQGKALPSQLEGVTVTVGGRTACLALVSPTQLNVLLPTGDISGLREVKVTNTLGSSSATTMIEQHAPGFFQNATDGRYVVATHADATLIGPSSLSPGNTARPAEPNEEIVLWGTGFGPTIEQVPAGEVIDRPYPISNLNDLRVTIGGRDARVTFAGVTSAGMYQVNAAVPDGLTDGDHLVQAQIGGKRTPDSVYLPVQRRAAGAIQVYYRLDPWLIGGTYGGGLWVAPSVFGPITQAKGSFEIEVKAHLVTEDGRSGQVPASWTTAHSEMVKIVSNVSGAVVINIQRAGEGLVHAAYQDVVREIRIRAEYVAGELHVTLMQSP